MAVAAAAFFMWLAPGHAAEQHRTVVELFTSQGCSRCPPADAFLGELARRKDVIALSFHVDYWNYIGWADPFSDRRWTERQRSYEKTLDRRYVYTPQMVVDGAAESVGSKRRRVQALIADAAGRQDLGVDVDHLDAGKIRIRIPARRSHSGRPATIWLAFYDARHETAIAAGENSGVTIANTNVVRSMRDIGRWNGLEVDMTLPLAALGGDGRDGCAVLVQQDGTGLILGAAAFVLPKR